MADKLDWLNQHPLWLLYPAVSEVVTRNHLNLSTPLQSLAERFPLSEDFLKALWHEGKFKDACTFCAYNTNPRVAVWWAYSCVVDLSRELLLKPAQKVKVEDIAKPRPLNIPDWCKFADVDSSELADPEAAAQLAQLMAVKDKMANALETLQRNLPAPLVFFVNESIEAAFVSMKDRCGYDPRDLLQEGLKQLKASQDLPLVDEVNSPIFKAAQDLQQKIETARQETAALINSVVPEEDLEKVQKLARQCLDAVWTYIGAPNEINAQVVFQLGNDCPNQIEGLLAYIAFWSYGSLTPNSEQVIKTPAGLMSNGINGLLVKCATALGGVYKPVERFERYFNLAFAALTNQSTWEGYVAKNTSPHLELQNELLAFMRGAPMQPQPQSQPQHQFQAQSQSQPPKPVATMQTTMQSATAQNASAPVEPQPSAVATHAPQPSVQAAASAHSEVLAATAVAATALSGMTQANSAESIVASKAHDVVPQAASAASTLEAILAAQQQQQGAIAVQSQPLAAPVQSMAAVPASEAMSHQQSAQTAEAARALGGARAVHNTRWRPQEQADLAERGGEESGTAATPLNTELPPDVLAQKQAAEQEVQSRLAQVRAAFNKRFRG